MQFDNAVVFAGETIEGAAQELVKVGPDDKPEWKNRYTMKELLDPEFRLPLNDESKADDLENLIETGHIHGLKYDEVG